MAFLFLAACTCKPVEGVAQFGAASAPYTDIAITAIRENLSCPLTLAGDIIWYDSPLGLIEIPCWQPAMGCAEVGGCEFTVWVSNRNPHIGPDILPVWRTALVNEIGYWVWNSCYGFIGETYDANGHEILDPGLAAWISSINAETEARASAP
jgi:hypothetical protein